MEHLAEDTMSNVLSYRRNDGVVGVGFLIEYGGIQQHSIAWPDRAPERYSPSMLDFNLIAAEPLSPFLFVEPGLPNVKPENDSVVPVDLTPVVPVEPTLVVPVTPEPALPVVPVVPNTPAEPAKPEVKPENDSEADWIRAYLTDNPTSTNAEVIEALGATGIVVTSSQVSRYRNA
jgi:hypothetical protein